MLTWLRKRFPVSDDRISSNQGILPPTLQFSPSASHKARGDTLLSEGNFPEAAACYREAIAIDPDNAKTYNNLGFALNEQGLAEDAQEALTRALVLDPRMGDAHYLLGTIAQTQHQAELACEHFRKALGLAPDFEFAYRDLAFLLFQRGLLADAKQVVLQGITHNPHLANLHFYLGNLYHEEQQLDLAVASFEQALSIAPDQADILATLGLMLVKKGQPDQAVPILQKAVALNSNLLDAHNNLGNALQELGRFQEAAASYRLAIQLNPAYPALHNNLGNTLECLSQFDEAVECFRLAIGLQPDFAAASNNLGNVLQKLGRFDDAIDCYRKALQIEPLRPEIHFYLGNALTQLTLLNDAAASYRTALTIKLDYAEAHYNLGIVLRELKQLDAAEICFQQAIQFEPSIVDARLALGRLLQEKKQFDDAIVIFRDALNFAPDNASIYNELGNIFANLNQFDEAVANYRYAVHIAPDYAQGYFNLGIALSHIAQLEEAVSSYRRAIQLKPDYSEAYNNLGNALKDLGRFDDSLECYRNAVKFKSDSFDAYSNILFACNYMPNQQASNLFAEAMHYGDLVTQQANPYIDWPNDPTSERRLRVGLVSGDLRHHAVGFFLEGIITALVSNASNRLELIAYATYLLPGDSVTERIKNRCHGWYCVENLSNESLARQIHGDGIDILIDLSGHTAHNRLCMFAWKPAPVQVSWLGYFATTGVKAIDYLIADPLTLPTVEEIHFTEKIWRLPETRLCFTAPDINVEASPLPALESGTITFGCFNNLTKMNDGVVELWASIMHAVPGSRLFLKAAQLNQISGRQIVLDRFAKHGIGEERLILEGYTARSNYLLAYHRVDIALDPFPYAGGTTSAESLWMGVPVLTLAGNSLISRQGLGLLTNAGLADWIAFDPADYVSRAEYHAGDLQRLATLREGLRRNVLSSPIFDADRFAQNFEIALRGMWSQWCDERNKQH
jgi:protein O-GlcNAc transferase